MSDELRRSTGWLGIRLFLLSLSILFAASLVGILLVRARAASWPPEGAPALPGGLWLSTFIIVASSATLLRAQRAYAQGKEGQLVAGLWLTLFLALAFFANQYRAWLALAPTVRLAGTALYGFSFFLLTVLHALHVLGGLVSLGVVTRKAQKGTLTANGLAYFAAYWHFLTAVWLVIFTALQLAF